MIFTRSPSALFSQHRFYHVDLLVYCEGGPPKSLSQALAPDSQPRTLDVIYWSQIASMFGKNVRRHFKSVGSKTTLEQIAQNVDDSGVDTVSICYDSDYDVLLARKSIKIDKAAQTYGYSWESDVLSIESVHKTLIHLVGSPPNVVTLRLEAEMKKLRAQLRRWCEIDISLAHKKKQSVLDRQKPLKAMDMDATPICVCHSRLKIRLTAIGYQRAPKTLVSVDSNDVLRICFGKLIASAIYHIVCHIASSLIGKAGISYEQFMRVAIAETVGLLSNGNLSELHAHHSHQAHAFG